MTKFKAEYDNSDTSPREWATIETHDGWYVCDVERCSGQSREAFKARVEHVLAALEASATCAAFGGVEPR